MFNFSNAEDISNVVPAGTYNVRVSEAELKQSSKGDKMIKLVFTITDRTGEFEGAAGIGRRIYQNFMMEGNEKAVQIAQSTLKALLKAADKPLEIQDVQEFVGIEVAAVVKVTPAKGAYSEGNSVSAFKPLPEGTQSQPF